MPKTLPESSVNGASGFLENPGMLLRISYVGTLAQDHIILVNTIAYNFFPNWTLYVSYLRKDLYVH